MRKLSNEQKYEVINSYVNEFECVATIGIKYGRCRQSIYKLLKKAGIDIKKQRYPVSCYTCGKEIMRNRKRIREQKRHFCSRECYLVWLETIGEGYKPWRQGQRIARHLVNQVFPLDDKMVVHHKDKDSWNNQIHNLKVFKNQGDHVRYHRGFEVKPIWEGK